MASRAAILLLAAFLSACGSREHAGQASVTELTVPARSGSRFPHIAPAGDDGLGMIWIEQGAEAPGRLLASVFDGRQWDEPQLLAEDRELFVNWADFPSLTRLDDDSLAVHWLLREGQRSYAYGIRFNVLSAEWAQRSAALRPHGDGSETEHGFVSLIPEGPAGVGLAWLDGRRMEGPDGVMQLRYRSWSPDGLTDEIVLDPDVCSCCQTAGVRVAGEPLVVYRDRAAGEIRDISFVRRRGGSWSAPQTLHRDGWEIAGCPVNGPAADAREDRIAIAWYTRAEDEPRVLLALSSDGATSFAPPLRLDDGDPLGRVDVKILRDGAIVVSWLEQVPSGVEIRLRRIDPASVPGPPLAVATTKALRESGFPRLALASGELFVAWTDPTSPPSVKLARIDF